MSGTFLCELVEFCKANFNFDPVKYAELADTLYNSSQNEEALTNLEFPNEEFADIFNYETLSLLLKTDKDFRDNHKEIVKNILIVIYNFYSGNKNAVDYLDIYYSLPLKNYCENIEKCVNNIENAKHFLLFNFLLNNINNIQEQYYDNIEFIILNILLLYDYAFIRNKLENINSKYAISLIIITLMDVYIKASDNYSMASKLANFFFEGGQINYKSFLVPENLYENGYKEFDELILIVKKIFEDESVSKDIIMKMEVLNNLQRIKQFKQEDNEETEISSEDKSNNNGELNKNNNREEPNINTYNEKLNMNNNEESNIINNNENLNIINNNIDLNMNNNSENLNINNSKEDPNMINNNEKFKKKNKTEELNIINNQGELNIDNNNKMLNINNNKGEFYKTNKEQYNNMSVDIYENIDKLFEKINKLNEEIVHLKESDETQKASIDYLKNIIVNKDVTIDIKEKNIKELKDDFSTIKKDLKESTFKLNESLIKINNLTELLGKNSQKITQLTKNDDLLNKEVQNLENDNKNIHNKIDLIGSRDFLRKIFSDFCFIFKFINNGNYEEIAKQMIYKIKNEKIDPSIKQFALKVHLLDFIDFLAKVLKESDNLSHYFFPELSIKFRDSDINELTNIEIIEKNINKCNIAFNEYCKMNFDSVFSFLIKFCDYPNLIMNKLNMSEGCFQQAIDNYNQE